MPPFSEFKSMFYQRKKKEKKQEVIFFNIIANLFARNIIIVARILRVTPEIIFMHRWGYDMIGRIYSRDPKEYVLSSCLPIIKQVVCHYSNSLFLKYFLFKNNILFYFFKIIFNINTSKQDKNTKKK